MFGYISAFQPELKLKEWETFQAYYCGLCRTLKQEYSQKARLLLNYDCTFLYLLMAAMSEKKPVYSQKRCAMHPLKKRYTTDGGEAQYAAAVNVLLGVNSLKDHAADRKNPTAAVAAWMYQPDYGKAKKKYPALADEIECRLQGLYALEQQQEKDIDKMADAFAVLLANVFAHAGKQQTAMRHLGYNLGRWIYLIDAFDDFEKDVKRGTYNPFVARFGKKLTQEVRDCAMFNLNASVQNAIQCFDLIELKKHQPLLQNIVCIGLFKKTESMEGRKGNDRDESI